MSFNQQAGTYRSYTHITSEFAHHPSLSLQSQEKEREQTHQSLEQVERGRAELDSRQALVEQLRADLAANVAKCEQLLTQIDTLTGEKLGMSSQTYVKLRFVPLCTVAFLLSILAMYEYLM